MVGARRSSVQIRICHYQPNIGGVRGGRSGNEMVASVMEAMQNATKARVFPVEMIQKLSAEGVSHDVFKAAVEELQKITLRLDQFDARLNGVESAQPAAAKPAKKPAKTEAEG